MATDLPTPLPVKVTPESHPGIHLWLLERDTGNTEAGRLFQVSRETVRKWRLPFGDALRQIPQDLTTMERVVSKTGGDVTAEDFYPPHLRRPIRPDVDHAAGDPRVLRHGRAL